MSGECNDDASFDKNKENIPNEVVQSALALQKYLFQFINLSKPRIRSMAINYFKDTFSKKPEEPCHYVYSATAAIHLAAKVCEDLRPLKKYVTALDEARKQPKYNDMFTVLGFLTNITDDFVETVSKYIILYELDFIEKLQFKFEVTVPYDYIDRMTETVLHWHMTDIDLSYDTFLEESRKTSNTILNDLQTTSIFYLFPPDVVAISSIRVTYKMLHLEVSSMKKRPWYTMLAPGHPISMIDDCTKQIEDYFLSCGINIHIMHEPLMPIDALQKWHFPPIEFDNGDREPNCPPPSNKLLMEARGPDDAFCKAWISRMPSIEPPDEIDYAESIILAAAEEASGNLLIQKIIPEIKEREKFEKTAKISDYRTDPYAKHRKPFFDIYKPMDDHNPKIIQKIDSNPKSQISDYRTKEFKSRDHSRDSLREKPRDPPRDYFRDPSRDSSRDFSRDFPSNPLRDSSRDFSRDFPSNPLRDTSRDFSRDIPSNPPRDFPRDTLRDFPSNSPRDFPNNPPRDSSRDFSRDIPSNPPRDFPRDTLRDFPSNSPRDFPNNPPRDFPRDPPRDFPRDLPREYSRDFSRDQSRDFKHDLPRDHSREFQRDKTPEDRRDDSSRFDPGRRSPYGQGPRQFQSLNPFMDSDEPRGPHGGFQHMRQKQGQKPPYEDGYAQPFYPPRQERFRRYPRPDDDFQAPRRDQPHFEQRVSDRRGQISDRRGPRDIRT